MCLRRFDCLVDALHPLLLHRLAARGEGQHLLWVGELEDRGADVEEAAEDELNHAVDLQQQKRTNTRSKEETVLA